MNSRQIYTIREGVKHQIVDGATVIRHGDGSRHFRLNKTGTEIWSGVAEGRDLGTILDSLAASYSEELDRQTLQSDLQELIGELLAHEIIQAVE